MMDAQYQFATRDDIWRLQEDLKDIYTMQAQQADRIARLEKRKDEDSRMKSLWAPQSPFTAGAASNSQEYNPAAEAFRNFETESQGGMTGSIHLDHEEERRRGASRANSVRFDESAMNHSATNSRQGLDMLPMRTGSGMGMSERSYSHRSDGKGSASALSMRANSFGYESSRLLGSATNSPRTSANPPAGFLFLGPVPSIIRCWLSEDFSNDSVLYAALCTGSYGSSISIAVLNQLGLEDEVTYENGVARIKMIVYLTEATIQHSSSSRSSSPAPQVPSINAKFNVFDVVENDRAIQVIIGSDILRAHNADILFSEERLLIFDEERNRLAVPLVRPESETAYRSLSTSGSIHSTLQTGSDIEKTPSRAAANGQYSLDAIRPPPKFSLQESTGGSSGPTSPAILPNTHSTDTIDQRKSDSEATDQGRKSEDQLASGGSGSEKSFPSSRTQPASGVWGNSWRSGGPGSSGTIDPASTKSASGYTRAGSGRSMKILRPSGATKTMANATRTISTSALAASTEKIPSELGRRPSQSSLTELSTVKTASSVASSSTKPTADANSTSGSATPSKSNPVGQASAFGWLNSSGR